MNHLVAIAVNSKRCECKQFLLNPIQSSISPQIAAKLQSSKELNGEYEDGKYTQPVVNTCVTAATLIHFKLLLQLLYISSFVSVLIPNLVRSTSVVSVNTDGT